MIVDRHIYYDGRVQGVGFRYTIKQIANGYEVTGWVRNLADGRVELLLRGERDEVEAFLAAIATGQLRPHIRDQHEGEPIGESTPPSGFEIRY